MEKVLFISMTEKTAYRILLGGTTLWCIAILSPPFLLTQDFSVIAFAVKKMFAPVCHQISERSISIVDIPLAVCARCSAMYFSFFFGILFWKKLSSLSLFSFPNVFIVLLPLALDVLVNISGISEQYSFFQTSHLVRRIVTGTLVGFSFGVAFVSVFISATKEIIFFKPNFHIDYESQTK